MKDNNEQENFVVTQLIYDKSDLKEETLKNKKPIDTEELFQGKFNIISNAKKKLIHKPWFKIETNFKDDIGDFVNKKIKFYNHTKEKEIENANNIRKTRFSFSDFTKFIKPFRSSSLVTPFMKYKNSQEEYFNNIAKIKTKKEDINYYLCADNSKLQVPEIGKSFLLCMLDNSSVLHKLENSTTRTFIPSMMNKGENNSFLEGKNNKTKYSCLMDKDKKKTTLIMTDRHLNESIGNNESQLLRSCSTNKNIFKSLISLDSIISNNENESESKVENTSLFNQVNQLLDYTKLPEIETKDAKSGKSAVKNDSNIKINLFTKQNKIANTYNIEFSKNQTEYLHKKFLFFKEKKQLILGGNKL